jgi:hypothetical protein
MVAVPLLTLCDQPAIVPPSPAKMNWAGADPVVIGCVVGLPPAPLPPPHAASNAAHAPLTNLPAIARCKCMGVPFSNLGQYRADVKRFTSTETVCKR